MRFLEKAGRVLLSLGLSGSSGVKAVLARGSDSLETPKKIVKVSLRRDSRFTQKPIPGEDVLSVLAPASQWTDKYGRVMGNVIDQGTEPGGYPFVAWEIVGAICKGQQGCPETVIFGGPNGTPTSRSCIDGYEVKNTVNPNFDPNNRHSKPIVPRYYATGRNDQCKVLPELTNPRGGRR
jgi:hypothetical protein